MKAISYLTFGVITVVFGSIVVPIGTHAETQDTTVDGPARLINFLAIDEIVSIRSSGGVYDIDLLDDEAVRSFCNRVQRLKEKIESAATENKQSDEDATSQRKRIEMIESEWYHLTSPWRVVRIGEDFVRLDQSPNCPATKKCHGSRLPRPRFGRSRAKNDFCNGSIVKAKVTEPSIEIATRIAPGLLRHQPPRGSALAFGGYIQPVLHLQQRTAAAQSQRPPPSHEGDRIASVWPKLAPTTMSTGRRWPGRLIQPHPAFTQSTENQHKQACPPVACAVSYAPA